MRAIVRSAKQAGMFCGVTGLVVSASFYMLGYSSFALGLFIGIMGGIGFFFLMWRQLKQNWEDDPKEAVAELQSGWVERALYVGGICAVAWFIPGVHFGGVLIGLLSLHIVVFVWGLIAAAKQGGKKKFMT